MYGKKNCLLYKKYNVTQHPMPQGGKPHGKLHIPIFYLTSEPVN